MPSRAVVSATKIKTKSKPIKETRSKLQAAPRVSFQSSFVYAIALVLVTTVAYANSLHGKFVFDDQQIVLQNSGLMNIRTLHDALAFGSGWRQLLFFTYGFNYYWSGLDTFSYHAVNLCLHILNVLLVYAILRVTLRDDVHARFTAFAGAAVFGVHTMLSGAVSYIAGRSSVLCGTFYFAAILLFLKGLDSTRWRTRAAYFASTGVAGLLAWQAKQETLTLPLFLAAIVFLRLESKSWRWIAPLAAIPAVVVILIRDQLKGLYTIVGENQILVSAGFEKVLPAATYFRTYLTSVVGYSMPRFIVPANLSADPPIAPVEHWYSPEFLFSMVVFAAAAWITLRFRNREPLLSLGLMALLISPLTAYAMIPLADVVLEHRAYIPGLGVAFVFAWAFLWVARHYTSVRWAALGLLLLVFTGMTISRNTVFASNIALWEDAEAKAPSKPRPHFNLGQAYQDAQRMSEAIREYEHALALKPDIYAAYSNMAAMYLDRGQLDKGEEMLLKVTSLAPNFTEGFINLGVLYIRKQQPDKALPVINRALELNAGSFAAYFNKGDALTQKGDFKGALEAYKEAVHLRPDIDSFRLSLGSAYSRAGDKAGAEQVFLGLTKTSVAAEAYRNLGVLCNESGRAHEAFRYFQQAAELKPVYAEAHHDLGVAYMRKQMPNEAIEQFRTTLQQKPDHGAAAMNLAMAYQMKGDVTSAKQTLQSFLDRFGNSPYVPQVRQRLAALP